MASNATFATVSYGIGVQNRYSAFLEDEDGFNSAVAASLKQQQQALASTKQKPINSQLVAKQQPTNVAKVNGRANGVGASNKLDQQKKGAAQQQQNHADGQQLGKRPQGMRQGNQGANNTNNNVHQLNNKQVNGNAGRPHYQQQHQQHHNNNQHQQGNINQENTANNNRFARNNQLSNNNNSNSNHQNNASHNNHNHHRNNINNKENDNKFVPRTGFNNNNNNGQQRPPRRPYFNNNNNQDGERKTVPLDDMATAANEEEKRRRQQKRAVDMKHKDPEKRENRRQQQQTAANGGSDNQQLDGNTATAQDSNFKRNRPQRPVAEGAEVGNNNARGGFRGGSSRGGRVNRRSTGEQADGVEQRRDGPRVTNRVAGAGGDTRPQRNRNGFGTGSRGSRSSRGDNEGRIRRDSERQRPINLADKLDFPSLPS